MSRIEEALRRVHGSVVSLEPEPAPTVERFRSPWEFQEPVVDDHETRAALRTPDPLGAESIAMTGGAIGGFNSQWKERLVISPDVDPFLVQQFGRLAATLHQAQSANNVRTVMVTSATPGDGKTQTAINLALISANRTAARCCSWMPTSGGPRFATCRIFRA